MSAGKGPRVHSRGAASIHRSAAGGLSGKASGGKGFAMLGHTGSSGRSMIARIPGAGCYDWFEREVTDGWGTATRGLGDWRVETGSDPTHFSTDGVEGVYMLDPSEVAGTETIMLDLACGRNLPYEFLFRVRNRDALASTLAEIPMAFHISGLSVGGTNISAGCDYYDFYSWPSGPLHTRFPSGAIGWPSGTYLYTSMLDAETSPPIPRIYFWIRLVVDKYGAYTRVWTVWEDEFAHIAPTQPADAFGDGIVRGLGQSWTSWAAHDVPLADGYVWSTFEADFRGLTDATYGAEMNMVEFYAYRGACCS